MSAISYVQLWRFARPEVIVVITAMIVMAVDFLALRRSGIPTRFSVAAVVGSIGCVGAIVNILAARPEGTLIDGTLIASPLTNLVQVAVLAITIFTLLVSASSTFTEHVGEFILLILVATAGMMFLVSTQDLLVIFLSLELLSLSLYVLAAFNKVSHRSWEAAIKYFLFGGMSAAFLLFGFSLLYGVSNSTSLPQIASSIRTFGLTPLVTIAFVSTTIGLGFKVAAAPLHFWAPDVYQGAPTPSAAFIASGSKVASFFVFFQVLVIGFAAVEGTGTLRHPVRGWIPVIAIVSAASMLLGNLVAIRQSSLRRLLAYSTVAHAGYMLLAIAAHTEQSLSALLYYVITYALTTVGAFAVIGAIEDQKGSDEFTSFEGLSRQAPVLSFCLSVYFLSLAGIPPLAGFFGKFYLFSTALHSESTPLSLLWLVVLAIAMSAVSLYYYLRVLKTMYVKPLPTNAIPVCSPPLTQAIAVVIALAIIVLGAAPNLLLRLIDPAVRSLGI